MDTSSRLEAAMHTTRANSDTMLTYFDATTAVLSATPTIAAAVTSVTSQLSGLTASLPALNATRNLPAWTSLLTTVRLLPFRMNAEVALHATELQAALTVDGTLSSATSTFLQACVSAKASLLAKGRSTQVR